MVSSTNGNVPYMSSHNANPAVGQLWWSSSRNRVEVYDGSGWQEIGNGIAMVDLSLSAQEIMSWAQGKMREEQDLKARMQRHPGLRAAYEQFRIMDVLTLEEEAQVE